MKYEWTSNYLRRMFKQADFKMGNTVSVHISELAVAVIKWDYSCVLFVQISQVEQDVDRR